MSDADNQMGGSGRDTGPEQKPGSGAEPKPGAGAGESGSREATGGIQRRGGAPGNDEVDEESEESFPASDPPANY